MASSPTRQQMGFPPIKNILNLFIINCGVNGLCERSKDQSMSNVFPKKGPAPPLPPFFIYFFMLHHIPRMIPSKEDLTLFITKKLVPLSLLKFLFFRKFILKQNLRLKFPSKQVLVNDILLWIVELTKGKYVSSSLEYCHLCIISFYLWMFRARVDTFVMIVHFLNVQWEPSHIIVGLFEITKTTESAMVF